MHDSNVVTATGYCAPSQVLVDIWERVPTPEELAAVDMNEPDPPEWGGSCPVCGMH